MGDAILETDDGSVAVTTSCSGTAMGFDKPTPTFHISTFVRVQCPNYVVLTRPEAVKVALAILRDEIQRKDMSVYTDYLRSIEVGLEKGKLFPGQSDGPADLPKPDGI